MNANRRLRGPHLLLLGVAFFSQAASAEDPEAEFKYSDEWSLVSAPPPAGPYQPVNIDPRVPGPGTLPQVPMAMPRLQAEQESPSIGTPYTGMGSPVLEQDTLENMTASTPDEPLTVEPVPGYYKPLMSGTSGEAVAESVSGEAAPVLQEPPAESKMTMEVIDQVEPATDAVSSVEPVVEQAATAAAQEQASESSAIMEQELAPAIPATADIGLQVPVADTSTVLAPEQTADEPPLTADTAPPVVMEPAVPAPGGMTAQESGTEVPAVPSGLTATQSPQLLEEMPLPQTAGSVPDMPVAEQSATALQEQPVYEPSMPGYYDRMMPPAAGRVAPEQPVARPGPADQFTARPAERAPATGYYGRSMPSARGYNYPAPGNPYQSANPYPPGNPYQSNAPYPSGYPYESGVPGYRNMPQYGYPGGQEWSEDNVPPPPVYDSMRYPGNPEQGYR